MPSGAHLKGCNETSPLDGLKADGAVLLQVGSTQAVAMQGGSVAQGGQLDLTGPPNLPLALQEALL